MFLIKIKKERIFCNTSINRRKTSSFFLLLALTLFVFEFTAQSAVTVDNTSSNGAFDGTTGVTSLTWSHTVNNGTSSALYVGVSTSATVLPGSLGDRVTSVTYNSLPLTRIGTQVSPNLQNAVEIFRLISPPVGTSNVVVSLNPGVANYVVGGSISLLGVNQTTPNGAFSFASGNSSSPAVVLTGGTSDDLVLDVLAVSPGAIFTAQGAGQTSRWNGRPFFSNSFDVGAGSTETGAASVTMSWTLTAADNWALGGILVDSAVSTGSDVSVSGFVTNNSGEPLSKVTVVLTNLTTGEEHIAFTNSKDGSYSIEGLIIGHSYQLGVYRRGFNFTPQNQIISLQESMSDVNIVGQPVTSASRR